MNITEELALNETLSKVQYYTADQYNKDFAIFFLLTFVVLLAFYWFLSRKVWKTEKK